MSTRHEQAEFAKKYKDPRWQKKRLEVFERDEFTCQRCYDQGDPPTPLHVHHKFYRKWGTSPWDYPLEALTTLCELCHESETPLRSAAEQRLIEVVMEHLTASQTLELAKALELALLYRAASTGTPWEVIDVVRWVMGDEDRLQELVVEAWHREFPNAPDGSGP